MRLSVLLVFLLSLLPVRAQTLPPPTFNVPTFPNLQSPTPIRTPTPNPTTVNLNNAILEGLPTAQYNAQFVVTEMAVQNDQIYIDGRPVIPANSDMAEIFGYSKWLTSSASYSLTGPFSPIVIHLGIFITLCFGYLLVYFARVIFQTVYEILLYLLKLMMEALG